MIGNIDGPRMPPAAGGKPSSLIVLLHGYGSNGEDLISLAPYWAKALPNTQFVSPNAPEPVSMAPGGYQWFPISRLDPREVEMGVQRASGTLEKFIDRELERYQIPPDRLALVGFSQGTMMALHVGLRRQRLGAIVGFSGALPAAGKLKDEARSKPPVLLIHGDQDEMIPVSALFAAAEGLAAAEIGAQWHVSYGVPHSIGPDGLQLGGEFLRAALAGKLK
ncbi:MAG: dienelactone hydrolase family protein [Hyphomonadaceae bacterium]|nr:dienelactone hydrolase family protein [Hyphomonadaceae bacterium]